MRRCILFLGILFFCFKLNGQQQALYTQFMYNKMVYNPGYVGSLEAPSFSLLHRSQWIGFEGRPVSTSLSFHTTVDDDRIGLGASITRHSIGISEDMGLQAVYCYRIPLGNAHLGLGLSPSLKYYAVRYTDERLQATQGIPIDNAISKSDEVKYVANIGFGMYFHSERFFIGLSAPRLARADIDFEDFDNSVSREALHFYLMTGYSFPLNPYLELTPQVMVRYVVNAPLNYDVNLMLSIDKKYHLGVTYRGYHGVENVLAESVDIMADLQLTKSFLIGFSYDVGVSPLRKYHNGSLEFVARYTFLSPEEQRTYENPRYF